MTTSFRNFPKDYTMKDILKKKLFLNSRNLLVEMIVARYMTTTLNYISVTKLIDKNEPLKYGHKPLATKVT